MGYNGLIVAADKSIGNGTLISDIYHQITELGSSAHVGNFQIISLMVWPAAAMIQQKLP